MPLIARASSKATYLHLQAQPVVSLHESLLRLKQALRSGHLYSATRDLGPAYACDDAQRMSTDKPTSESENKPGGGTWLTR